MKKYLPSNKILSILIIIVVFIIYFSWPKNLESPSEQPVVKVKILQVEAIDKQEELEVSGISNTKHKIDIKSDIDGNIFQIFANEGDLINEDDKILSIISTEQHSIISSSRRKLNLNKNSSEQNTLNEANFFTKQYYIDSPFKGYIDKINIVKGERVNKGDLVASIVNLDPLIIESYLPEQYSSYLKKEDKVKVNFTNFPIQEGTIVHISKNADLDTKNILVKIEIKNQFNVNNNVNCRIIFPLRSIKAFKIPSSSLTINEQGMMGIKYLAENNIVNFSTVKLISQDEDNIWVTSANHNKLNVIILGQNLVKEGQIAIAELIK